MIRTNSIARNGGRREKNEEGMGSETRREIEDDVDVLFKLPLAEFIGARNDLAARLKRAGRTDDANLVKALAKPSISAWAVNQLHWNHREEFERLLAASQRFRQAQTSDTAGRITDVRGLLDGRRDALSHLSDLATVLLRDAGYKPTPEMIHRITTTLEAVSAFSALSDGLTPGHLTNDVDPPGFASLASWISRDGTTKRNDKLTTDAPSQESASAAAKTRHRSSTAGGVRNLRQAEETRRASIAATKTLLQEARRSLTEARSRAQRLNAAQKKADAEAKKSEGEARQYEKQLRKAEERFKKASAASQDAARRAERIAAEAEEAAQSVGNAERNIEKASKELERQRQSTIS